MRITLFLPILIFSLSAWPEVDSVPSVDVSPSVSPAEKGASPSDYLICKNNSVVRTIRIEKKKGFCQTTYTKEGVESVQGKSSTEGRCREIFDKIKGNLERGNWKCKDISQSRVSTSLPE